MSKYHQRGNSMDEFKLIQRNQKENLDQSNVNEKLKLMEKQMCQNESYNDQYLLTNSIENSALKLRTQNGSISFHFQSYDAEKGKSKKNSLYEDPKKTIEEKQQYQSTNDTALVMLLNEFEKRFSQIEDRLDQTERSNRQINGKYTQDFMQQLQDKLGQLLSRLGKFESKLKNIEDAFAQHKNHTEKRIIEYNQHVDQSLKQFIDSSIKIQKKIDRLTGSNPSNSEIEYLKQKTDNLQLNLSKTHDLLTQQMCEFGNLQSQINQLIKNDPLENLSDEIAEVKQDYEQTMHYLKELQEYLMQ